MLTMGPKGLTGVMTREGQETVGLKLLLLLLWFNVGFTEVVPTVGREGGWGEGGEGEGRGSLQLTSTLSSPE